MLKYADIDRSLSALAEPTRRSIVERLSRGPASVSELAKPYDMTLGAIVQHIQVLEASGLVKSEKVGRVRTCRIEVSGLNTLASWVTERRAFIERSLDRLGEILDETNQPTQSEHIRKEEEK